MSNILQTKVDTMEHIHRVQHYINKIIRELIDRAEVHDTSKLESPELEGFAEAKEKLANVEYNSDEYKKLLDDLKPTIDHHYSKNSHHPEFYKNGIDDFDLLDLLEMFADWAAASERNKNGNLNKSIESNAKRFNMSSQLVNIFENTVRFIHD